MLFECEIALRERGEGSVITRGWGVIIIIIFFVRERGGMRRLTASLSSSEFSASEAGIGRMKMQRRRGSTRLKGWKRGETDVSIGRKTSLFFFSRVPRRSCIKMRSAAPGCFWAKNIISQEVCMK